MWVSYSTQFWRYLVVTHTLNSWSVHFFPANIYLLLLVTSSFFRAKKNNNVACPRPWQRYRQCFGGIPVLAESPKYRFCARNPHRLAGENTVVFLEILIFGENHIFSHRPPFFQLVKRWWNQPNPNFWEILPLQKSADISCSFVCDPIFPPSFPMMFPSFPVWRLFLSQRLEPGEGQEGQAVHFDLEGFVVDHGPCWWPSGKTMGILSIKNHWVFGVFFCIFLFLEFKKCLNWQRVFFNTIDMKTEDFSIQALEYMYVYIYIYIYIIIEYSPIQTSIMMASAWTLQFEHQQKDCEWGR